MKLFGLVALFLLAFAAAPVFAQTAIPSTEFRDSVIARTKAQRPDIQVEITGPLAFTFNKSVVNLESGYAEYRNKPDQLSAIVHKWAQILIALADSGSSPDIRDLKERVVHVARNKSYLESASKGAPLSANQPIWRPIAGDMIAVLMADFDTTMSVVTGSSLTKAGLTVDEAWRLAGRNTAERMGPLQIGSLDGDGPVALAAESGLATGLLADANVCATGPLADGAIVLVVDRNAFIVGRASDPDSIGPFWAYAKPAIRKHELASDTPIACKNGKWTTVDIPR